MYFDEDFLYKEQLFFPKKGKGWFYTTIKTSKYSQTKVCIIHPQLWDSRVVKSFLT